MSEGSDDTVDGEQARVDAVDRVERVIDAQLTAINELDQKAEHVTRLVGILLGLVLTAVSLAPRLGGRDIATTLPTVIAVSVGVIGLVAAVAGAIITYLSSKTVVGMHPRAAREIADTDFEYDEYNALMLRAYADAVEQNKQVLFVNALRFRYTLVALLGGIAYLSLAVLLFALSPIVTWAWILLLTGTAAIAVVAWYLLTGKYLPRETKEDGNEQQ